MGGPCPGLAIPRKRREDGPRAARPRPARDPVGPGRVTRVTVVSICLVLYGTVHRRVAEPGMHRHHCDT